MEKNLVEDTVEVLTSMKPMHEMVRQGCFDLLSTIMKLNVEAFTKCDAALDSPRKFQTFISSVDDSLVDSNMFIRSLILTVHNIHTNDPDQTELLMTNRLFKHYCSHEQRIQVVARLIGILDVSSLSQETVSCLNTSLLLLIIAHRNGKLASYLQCLFGVYEPSVLENLHNLLQFWLVHYNLPFKENDRKCLEQSSLTNFPEWTAVTEKLLEQDITSETSIKHYLAKSEEIGRAHGSADLPYIRWP
uniref:Uncharacterized protein n=1 Tax=Ciona savignyi TaxID=51511 RepID=H2ZFZ2_CIOSA